MQYILSQEEYDELKNNQKNKSIADKKELQKVCTKIANEMPIIRGSSLPVPWGCIIGNPEHYCDDCPVQTICPKEWKSWSK